MRFNKKLIIFLKPPFKRLTTGFVFAIIKAQSEVDMNWKEEFIKLLEAGTFKTDSEIRR